MESSVLVGRFSSKRCLGTELVSSNGGGVRDTGGTPFISVALHLL
jgi:hypothetical protein